VPAVKHSAPAFDGRLPDTLVTPRAGLTAQRFKPRVVRDFNSHTVATVSADEAGIERILSFALAESGLSIAIAGPGKLVVLRVDALAKPGDDGLGGEQLAPIVATAAPIEKSAHVRFSGTGRLVAAMEGESAIIAIVLDIKSGKVITLTPAAPAEALAFSSDGTRVTLVGHSRAAEVFEVAKGSARLLFSLRLDEHVFAFSTCVSFSPDDLDLAIGGDMRRLTSGTSASRRARAPSAASARGCATS
jgi:hypothetical protein